MNIRNRAETAIAQGSLTNSKRPETFIEDVYPTHAYGASGACVFSEKQHFIDYICGLGTNLLGYGHPTIASAIYRQYLNGSTISLSTELEVVLAEKLKGLFLFTDLWKFTKTGTEACNAAIRIARAHTGRDLILSDGYHGHGDDFISLHKPALGIPKRNWIDNFIGDLDFGRVSNAAAVIIEPVTTDCSKERKEFLQRLRDECTKHKTVLIFDEIITGFRWPGYSVSKHWGIFPDLICIGKALGGGLPLSAVGGRKDIMNCADYFVSGTFFGETCSMAAALAMIDIIHKDGSKFSMKELWEKGEIFLDKFNELHPSLKINGYPSRGVFEGNETVKALFWQEACKANILFGPSWFFNFPLIEYTDTVIPISRDIFNRIKTGQVKLEGKMPKKPFSQEVRDAK
jgi:glutamate-1-semialdehyde 2,1-aminomutase